MPRQRLRPWALFLALALLVGSSGVRLGALAAEPWIPTGPLPPRSTTYLTLERFTATLLPDGRVLAVGGLFGYPTGALYDSTTNTWAATGPLGTPRYGHTATLLADGTVLIVGGSGPDSASNRGIASAERFDPAKNSWSAVAPLREARFGHTATLLNNGMVLVTGGSVYGPSPSSQDQNRKRASTELYDPATDQWTAGPSMAVTREGHTATRLPDGRVLVTGGLDQNRRPQSSAEIYDPSANAWRSVAAMTVLRSDHRALPLQDGTVLVVGGTSAERYDAQADRWTTVMMSAEAGQVQDAIVLPDGQVVLVDGTGQRVGRFNPTSGAWTALPAPATSRPHPTLILVDGMLLLVGGEATGQPTAERYGPLPEWICFAATGRCVPDRFNAYWQAHGGLALNGYPLSDPFPERLEDGKVYLVQYFERVRLESHPENPAPNDILLGQFGRRIHPADPPIPPSPNPLPADRIYVPETGHYIAGPFFSYWYTNGGIAQFGYPLTEEFTERLEDGKVYKVQYFERARFEYHPENQPPYDVLLGQFGRQFWGGR